MPTRHPIPRTWLFTDPRLGEGLWMALERLPRGSGVVFRHYELADASRKALFARVAGVAKRRRLVLIRAGRPVGARADGVHGVRGPGMRTAGAHDRCELIAAVRAGADVVFVSPVFPTRSHPGGRTLGRVRLGLLSRGVKVPVVALGGMTARRARSMPGIHGWAAIDAWGAGQP